MISEITLDDRDELFDCAAWALRTGVWDGRPVQWEALTDFHDEITQNITQFLFSQDPNSQIFEQLAAQLLWMGASPSERPFLAREFDRLNAPSNGVIPAGFQKEIKKFWKKHKTEILIGAGIVAGLTGLGIVIYCATGTATAIAATGCAALDSLLNKKNDPPSQSPKPIEAPPPKASPLNDLIAKVDTTPQLSDPLPFPQYIPQFENQELPYWAVPREMHEANQPSFTFTDPFSLFESNYPKWEVPPPSSPTIHYHCGINNTVETVIEAKLKLEETLNNRYQVEPHRVHDDSILHGLGLVGLDKLGISRNTADHIFPVVTPLGLMAIERAITGAAYIPAAIDTQVEKLSSIAREILSQNNHKLKQVHVTFSNGGSEIKQVLEKLPPEYRDTVIIIATGTTIILDDNLACKVYNIIGEKDWPSRVCNGGTSGLDRKSEHAEIRMIPQTETKAIIGGHYFTQPDYQKRIEDIISKEIQGKYEIY